MLYNVIKYYKMPKTVIDYQNTVIYKIVCKDLNIKDLYVGSTTNFTQRKKSHKKSCNHSYEKGYHYYLYEFIRKNGGWNNWDMIEVEKYSCNDKNEALKRERYWLEELKATLNIKIPSQTKEEWTYKNKEHIDQYKKNWYEENKEEIKEQRKKYYGEHKDEIKEQKKKYQNRKKDEIKEQKKKYYEEHKEEINKKVECTCGSVVCKGALSRHLKSKKHKDYEKNGK